MRGILFLVFMWFALSLTPGAAMAQASPLDCKGTGCCCNRQAGGDWPDCAKGYECRGQTGPPYAQVCVKKGASALTVLSLRPSQPAKCELPADARRETEPEVAGTGCTGVGCCCNRQAGGDWPDCARGFECRRQTGPPHMQLCVKKGARANTPLQLLPSEPANCVLPAARGGHPSCAGIPVVRNRKLCDKIISTQQAACTKHLTGTSKRKCLKSSESFAESVTHQHKACRGHQNCLMNVRQLMEAAARHLGILKKN